MYNQLTDLRDALHQRKKLFNNLVHFEVERVFSNNKSKDNEIKGFIKSLDKNHTSLLIINNKFDKMCDEIEKLPDSFLKGEKTGGPNEKDLTHIKVSLQEFKISSKKIGNKYKNQIKGKKERMLGDEINLYYKHLEDFNNSIAKSMMPSIENIRKTYLDLNLVQLKRDVIKYNKKQLVSAKTKSFNWALVFGFACLLSIAGLYVLIGSRFIEFISKYPEKSKSIIIIAFLIFTLIVFSLLLSAAKHFFKHIKINAL